MPEIFREFTTTFFFLVSLIIVGIIFEKQLIALEDRFDEWIARRKVRSNEQNNREICANHSAEQ